MWVGEGITTFLGGKSDHSLEWYLQRLKRFFADNPDFDLFDLKLLRMDIPNGPLGSDLRYLIGGLLMGQIYEREGVDGLIEALQYGRTDADFFQLLEDKLGVEQGEFDAYVKAQMQEYGE